jgi:hypothetical protein
MMRKRKALSSVNGNILSRPPVRRLNSYVSMETLEDRGQADSKTPKISNIGGSSANKTTKRRTTHRRPPLYTRPKEGSLGSSILDPAKRTPRTLTRVGISSRLSPKKPSPNQFVPEVNRMTPKLQRAPIILHQAPMKQPQVAHLVEPSFEKSSIDTQGSGTCHHQAKYDIPTIDESHDNSKIKRVSRTVTLAAAKELESRSKECGDAFGVVNRTQESDEDMNCDSSDGDSLLNSSDSSPDEQRGLMSSNEIRPSPQATSNHRQSLVQNRSCGDSPILIGADQVVNSVEDSLQIADVTHRMSQGGEALNVYKREPHILGSTIGAKLFERENLEEDTDLTDMASPSSDDEHTSDGSSDDKDHDDENHDDNTREKVASGSVDHDSDYSHRRSVSATGEMEHSGGRQRTARCLTFDDSPQASLEEFSMTAKAGDPREEESIEAWSIGCNRNSPILIKIDGKKYVHPPLPAGWRIKISKTHKRPIYIHPDIGRTFHCPVDLPRNVFYVRRKDGTLEKRAKVDMLVATHSPRARRAPDTPPSATKQSPESCSRSPSNDTLGSASSTFASDSTSQLIRGALKLSALCVKNSSQNLLRAATLMGSAKTTPSTLSDVVRLYEKAMSKEREFVQFQNPRDKDGYDCDISDSGRSIESSSSLASIQKTASDEKTRNCGSKPLNTGVLSLVLATPLTGEVPRSQRIVEGLWSDSAAETQTSTPSESNKAKKRLRPSSIHETLETWLTPTENGKDTKDNCDHTLDDSRKIAMEGQFSSVPASAQKLVQGEYIDGWFTPNAIADQEVEEYEEVVTLRHGAKRRKSNDCDSKSAPKTFKRGLRLSTDRNSSSAVKKKNHKGILDTEDSKTLPNRRSKGLHSQDTEILNTPHPTTKSIVQSPEKQKEQQTSGEEKTTSNELLPFFDIFEKHLAVEIDSPVATTDEGIMGITPTIQEVPTDLKGPLPDWKSPNCSEIKGSSPMENDISCSSPVVGTPSSPFNRHVQKSESRSKAQEAVDESSPTSEKGSDHGDNRTEDNEDMSGPRDLESEVSSPATDLPNKEKKNRLRQSLLSPSESGEAHLKHGPTVDDAPSDVEFQATDYQSLEISNVGLQRSESVSCRNDESHDASDPSPSTDNFHRDLPKSLQEPHHDDDNGVEGVVFHHDYTDWTGSGNDGASSPTIVSIRRRRMSWRVLNPTYPICSLQRLEEIALHQKKKPKNRISSNGVKKRHVTKKRISK